MPTKDLVAANAFCISHNIEISFIHTLHESGLIDIVTIGETGFIPADQLSQLEKMVRFHYEMDINLEGIETITHLLQQLAQIQNEMLLLRNRLRLYELIE